MIRDAILVLAAFCAFSAVARAGFIVNVEQSGANVVANGSGTINMAALTSGTTAYEGVQAGVQGSIGFFVLNLTSPDPNRYAGVTGPTSFGPGGFFVSASTSSGPAVAIFGSQQGIGALAVDDAYVSGSSISDSATWDNTTISGLGLTPGNYTWTWGSGSTADFFELQIATVPEPSSFILLGVVGVVGFIAYRWRRRASVPA